MCRLAVAISLPVNPAIDAPNRHRVNCGEEISLMFA